MIIAIIILSALLVTVLLVAYTNGNKKDTELGQAKETVAALKAELECEKTKNQLLEKNDERFKALAAQVLNENSREFKRQNEERLTEILSPIKENLQQFHKAVTDAYNTEARERFSLSERIKELTQANQAISQQAHDLSEALKGNVKATGNWGEMILETILEKSGLRKGEEYELQRSVPGEDGNLLRPDAIVKYPDGRCVVIDSKVSLSAFLSMNQAQDKAEKEKYAQLHAVQVQRQIEQLRNKQYQNYVGDKKLDFVMMFIPNEPAYLTALNVKPELWEMAYKVNVLIVSPTHLIAALRLIEVLWKRDKQTKNALDIADEASKMYDKLNGFIDDMLKIEKGLKSASDSYQNALKKLSSGPGNVLKRAENLKKLGVKTTKAIALLTEDDE